MIICKIQRFQLFETVQLNCYLDCGIGDEPEVLTKIEVGYLGDWTLVEKCEGVVVDVCIFEAQVFYFLDGFVMESVFQFRIVSNVKFLLLGYGSFLDWYVVVSNHGNI